MQSFDVADFPVPAGREEEWRFTPLRRLRGLHSETGLADGKVSVAVDAAPGIAVESKKNGDPGLGTAYVPGDRVSARAFGGFAEATVLAVPEGLESREPSWVSVRGEGADGTAFGHIVVDVGAIAAAQIAHCPPGVATNDRAVATTNCFAAGAQPAFLGAPDEELVFPQGDFEAFFGFGVIAGPAIRVREDHGVEPSTGGIG